MSLKNDLEGILAFHIQAIESIPEPVREFRFAAPERKWRADFAWPSHMLLVEVEGGTWVRGAHTRGAHFESDCEKYNWAALHNWTVLRFTTNMVQDGRAFSLIEEFFLNELS